MRARRERGREVLRAIKYFARDSVQVEFSVSTFFFSKKISCGVNQNSVEGINLFVIAREGGVVVFVLVANR